MTTYCAKCGTPNDDAAASCSRCGDPLRRGAAPVSPAPVPSHLVWAILCTIFCCMPFGVVAIVYAATSKARSESGDYAGALRASQSAKTWCWASFLVGLSAALVWVFLAVLGAVAEAL